MGKNSTDKMQMIFEKGQNWNDYPQFFKQGSYFSKVQIERENEQGKYIRNVVEELDISFIQEEKDKIIRLLEV